MLYVSCDTGFFETIIGICANTNITITQPATALSATMAGTNVKCNGLNNGSVSVNAIGGIPPYSYSWNTGATTSGINNLSPGNYSVTVKDSNGCSVKRYDTIHQPANTLDSVRICMVTVDTGSKHNIIVWNKTGLNNIDSFKVYYMNFASAWQMIGKLPYSASQFTDTIAINNPNTNTVRYCLTGVDSCGDEEPIASSPWQNTMYVNNSPTGTFIWAGTGYLIENVSLPVLTYYLWRDTISNGNWQAIDSVSGTQNKMTDPNYSKYSLGRWYVSAKLNISGCPIPSGRIGSATYTYSRSNMLNGSAVGIPQVKNENSISLYPNPANNVLNIKFDGAREVNANLSIVDITGRTIMERKKEILPDGNAAINVTTLTPGIYFVKIVTDYSSRIVKFIKE